MLFFAALITAITALSDVCAAPALTPLLVPRDMTNATTHELVKRNDFCKSNYGATGSFGIYIPFAVEMAIDGELVHGSLNRRVSNTCTSDDLPVKVFDIRWYTTSNNPSDTWPEVKGVLHSGIQCVVTGVPWTSADWWMIVAGDYTYRFDNQPAGINMVCTKTFGA